MAPGRFKQGVQVRMASAPFTRDPRELGFGNADLLVADGPMYCHSSPLVCSRAKPYWVRRNARA
jgi:hypothetical protein